MPKPDDNTFADDVVIGTIRNQCIVLKSGRAMLAEGFDMTYMTPDQLKAWIVSARESNKAAKLKLGTDYAAQIALLADEETRIALICKQLGIK